MRLLLPLLAFALWLAPLVHAADTAPIRTGAEKSAKAMESGDYAMVLDLTHPKIVELGGGRESMLRQVQAAMESMKKQGMVVRSVTVGQPVEPVAADAQAFSIVPTTLKLETPKVMVTSEGFLLAISEDRGATWSYVDGSVLTPDILKKLFPNAPATLKLPEKKQPTVEEK